MEAAKTTAETPEGDEGLDPDAISDFMNECARRFEAEQNVSDLFGVDAHFVDDVVAKAYQLYKSGQYDQARVLLEGACALEPERSYARLLRGDVCLRLGELKEARRQFEKAYELDESDMMIVSKLGEVCLQTDQEERAVDLLERVLEEAEPSAPHTKRARALLETVDAPEAD